ncbi:hypothetical protein F5Y19DRAFT_469765 [Xylariaceae sp. FL1651]|nr:hypothetical protein F5Y19DRAFT_469765 [Xylariaceae sp. FL1651]
MPSAFVNRLSRLWVAFLGMGPFWLVLFLGFSTYSNDYRFAWKVLIRPGPFGYDFSVNANVPLGFAFLIVSTILKVYWFGSWVQCLVLTWLCDRKWVPNKSSKNSIRQVDDRVFPDLSSSDSIRFEEVTIYLRTIKLYLFTILFLTLDGLFTLVTSITALAWPHQPAVTPFVVSVMLAGIVIAYVAGDTAHMQFDRLLRRNVTAAEDKKLIHLAFKFRSPGPNGEWRLLPRHLINPWDLGFEGNWRQVLGQHWYQWLVPFWSPERVSRYGKYGGLGDLPWGQAVRDFQSDFLSAPLVGVSVGEPGSSSTHVEGPSRRGQARSDVSRRSQQRSSGASTGQVAALTWADLQRLRRRPEQESNL